MMDEDKTLAKFNIVETERTGCINPPILPDHLFALVDIIINVLQKQMRMISNTIEILTAKKEGLQREYNLPESRNREDASQWIETNFEWSQKMRKLLQEKFKFQEFRSKQLAAINATLSKNDVLLVMPTGSGKSLVYQLPALINNRLTLVISPLISLIEDQLIALRKLGIVAATLNNRSTKHEKTYVYNSITSETSKLNLLYVTPEWVAIGKPFMTYLQKCFDKGYLDRIVIDEVHCCSILGHDFRPDYNHLRFFKTIFPGVPILGLTATATLSILIDIQHMLDFTDAIIITAPFNKSNLYYKVINKPPDPNDCLDILVKLLKHDYKHQSGIIYTTTSKECEDLSKGLRQKGLNVRCYHAQLNSDVKNDTHRRWLKNKYQAVVATNAFGMGIDKPDVRFVIHYYIPKSIEGLYQVSGRAGRDGKRSDCIIMFNVSDFLKNFSVASSKIEEKNSKSILGYCLDQERCRRAIIAEHFEETSNQTDCDKLCDNCKYPSKEILRYNISSALRDILNLIALANKKEIKLTLSKLIACWFQYGAKELRNPDLKKPKCSKKQAEHIIGFLIFKGYLNIDKGYTMYATETYIQKGEQFNENDIAIMPYCSNLGYKKIVDVTEVNANKPEEEPSSKRKKN